MGLTQAGMQKFMGKVDEALEALFPATLRLDGKTYDASGVGGSAMNTYLAGGRAEQGERLFRISKEDLTTAPKRGAVLEWTDATGPVSRFTIMEVPDRPHETSWMIRAEPVDR